MPRLSMKSDDLETITARRAALVAELAAVDEKLRAAEAAARDAGRQILLAALAKVKIPAMEKNDAKAIAEAISKNGGGAVAQHVGSLKGA